MSRTATAERDRQRSELKITEAIHLLEAPAGESVVAADGTVMIHLIRPCVGKGRGRHVYEAEMLREHAQSGHFNDWPMFIDHESPEARKAARGLPRSFNDLGGRVIETHWDDTVPEGDGFGRGAVVAKVLPVPDVTKILEHDPKLAAVSINTFATGVKPTMRGGRTAYIVEGFEPDGSVDWVTRAGAGGKVVAQLLEAMYDEEDGVKPEQLLEAMPDERIVTWLQENRPAVAETLNADHGEEDDDVKPEELRAAIQEELRSDETKTVLGEVIQEAAGDAIAESLRDVLPGAIGKAAEVIETQAVAGATKAVRMGALRTKALAAVAEAKLEDGTELPQRFRDKILESVGIPDLDDKFEGEDDDRKLVETAEAQFDVLLEAELKDARELVEAARPAPAEPRRRQRTTGRTAVTGNGSGGEGTRKGDRAVQETEDDDPDKAPYRVALQEAGVDVHEAYGVPRPQREDPDEAAKREREAAAAAAAAQA